MRTQLAGGEVHPEPGLQTAEEAVPVLSPEGHSSVPSFERLFDEYQPLVYNVGLRFLGTPQDAEDATQEVFTKVWRNLKAFNHNSSLKTWIYRIAVNTCIDQGRKPWRKIDSQNARTACSIDGKQEIPHLVTQETAERSLLAKEKAVELRKAVAGLRPHLKDVFILKELEDMSYDEISSVLGLSMGTISSRLNRARKALQESLRTLVPGPTLAGARA